MKKEDLSINKILGYYWSKRISVIKVLSIFLITGVIIALTTPKEWSTYTQLLPESQTNNNQQSNSSLKNLAGLAGINLGSGESASLNPLLYSEIIESYEFSEAVLNEKIYFSKLEDSLIVRDYLTEHWETALTKKALRVPFKVLASIVRLFKSEKEDNPIDPNSIEGVDSMNEPIIFWTKIDEDFHKLIQSCTSVRVDELNGLITISASFQDSEAAAQLVEFTKKYLVDYVSSYNTKKQEINLEFLNKQMDDADSVYKSNKLALANFQDNNIGITTANAKVRLDYLQYEVDLAFNLYSQLASKKQEAELLLQENKPVFTVLKPIMIPLDNSKPNRPGIVILSTLLGFILSSIWLFYVGFIRTK